jgi:hypothetical protein
MPRELLDDLQSYERRVYSQGGEDGVISRIFECIGTSVSTEAGPVCCWTGTASGAAPRS